VDAQQLSQAVPGIARWSRLIYVVVAWLFLAAIAVQVFFAGLGVFAGSGWWTTHMGTAHIIEYLPILLIPLALLGRFPRSIVLLSILLVVLFGLQYAFIGAGRDNGIFWLAALHPVNALAIFWVTLTVAQKARRILG
jgi:hypothetical protein